MDAVLLALLALAAPVSVIVGVVLGLAPWVRRDAMPVARPRSAGGLAGTDLSTPLDRQPRDAARV